MAHHKGDLEKFRSHLLELGRSQATAKSYVSSIRLYLAQGYSWTFEDACRWKEEQMMRMKPATVNLRIHALGAYGDFLGTEWRLRPVRNQVGQYVEHQLTMAAYVRLVTHLQEERLDRWFAIVKLLACTGLRISEAMQVTLADVRNGWCDVKGKGSKYRRVWFSSRLRKDILSVLDEEGPIIPYTDGMVRKRLRSFAAKCRIEKEALHPHEFRAFFARCVYDRCRDLRFIQDLLGHADIKTTARYLRKTSRGVGRRVSRIVTW